MGGVRFSQNGGAPDRNLPVNVIHERLQLRFRQFGKRYAVPAFLINRS